MLKRIRLKDFKSFVDEEVELAPLTLLVGANASGKSNFLDAIRFLNGLVTVRSLNEVLNGEKGSGPDSWKGIRGRSEESARLGADEFSIETLWQVQFSVSRLAALRHAVTCLTSPDVRLQYESIGSLEEQLLQSIVIDGEAEVRNSRGEASRTDGTQSLMLDLFRTSAVIAIDKSAIEAVVGLSLQLRSLQFLEITPSKMRDYGAWGDPLGEDGHNLSGVLADLCQDPDDKQALVHWLAELCAPDIEDLDFLEVKELGDVMAMFVEKDGKRISARSVSDGTLHFLGTLLALRTAEPGSVILIEEIETGLHPTRIRLLVEYLETVTRERDVQVIATTHSPVVLQWLSDESLRNTVVFGRVPEHEGTIMRRLGDLPHFEEVIQKKGIEELFSTGWLEMAL